MLWLSECSGYSVAYHRPIWVSAGRDVPADPEIRARHQSHRGSRLVKLCEVLRVKPEQLLGNGTGVLYDEPETLIALQDKDVTRIVMALSQLPKARRHAVAQCLLLLVKAFEQKIGVREHD
jgi:hypothetical protein